MPRARLRLTVPETLWIGELSRAHPAVEFTVLTAFADDDRGVALVELATDDPAPVVADLTAFDEVTAVDVLHRDDTATLVEIDTSEPLLLLPVQRSGAPLEFPFSLADGEATWTVTAPHDRLSELGDQFREFGIDFAIDYVRQPGDAEQLLADRQRELLAAALDHGYYDTPRECTLTELADELDMAKSTVSETLHRVEEQVLKSFAREPPEPRRSTGDRA